MQGAVYIDYSADLDNPRRHDRALQLLDDLCLNASFIGISPTSSAYAHSELQPEWNVLKPALELAVSFLESATRRYVVFRGGEEGGRKQPSEPLLHRHFDGCQRPPVEFF